jgi:hypothetical protein
VAIQLKTARLTVLLDPPRKLAFERACRENDMTPSQVLRHLIRDYVESQVQPVRAARRPPASPVPRRANSRHG